MMHPNYSAVALAFLAVIVAAQCRPAVDEGIDGAHSTRSLKQTCKNSVTSAIPCPTTTECNWNETAVKVANADGSYNVTLINCLIPDAPVGSTISFISVSDCTNNCTKTENVTAGSMVGPTFTIPATACFVEICIYVHDGRYRKVTPNTVGAQALATNCIQAPTQACMLCDYKVKIYKPPGSTCSDGNADTCNDACSAAGDCLGGNKCGDDGTGSGVCFNAAKGKCGTCVQVAGVGDGCGQSFAAVCAPYTSYITDMYGVGACSENDIANVGEQCSPGVVCCGFKQGSDRLLASTLEGCEDLKNYIAP